MQNDNNNEKNTESRTMEDDSPRNQDITLGHNQSDTEVIYSRSNTSVGDADKNKCTVVFGGHAGDGITPLANEILGCELFDAKISTKEVTVRHGKRHGTYLKVVDTPGLGKAGLDDEIEINKIIKGLNSLICMHCLVFVLAARTFTKGRCNTLSFYINCFGLEFYKRTIFVFTGFDRRAVRSGSFEEFLKSADPFLSRIITRCNKRYIPWFSNIDNEGQLTKFFTMVGGIIREHGPLDTKTIKEMEVDEPISMVSSFEFDQMKRKIKDHDRQLEELHKNVDKMRIQHPSTCD